LRSSGIPNPSSKKSRESIHNKLVVPSSKLRMMFDENEITYLP
jgi:hypothetical protein